MLAYNVILYIYLIIVTKNVSFSYIYFYFFCFWSRKKNLNEILLVLLHLHQDLLPVSLFSVLFFFLFLFFDIYHHRGLRFYTVFEIWKEWENCSDVRIRISIYFVFPSIHFICNKREVIIVWYNQKLFWIRFSLKIYIYIFFVFSFAYILVFTVRKFNR